MAELIGVGNHLWVAVFAARFSAYQQVTGKDYDQYAKRAMADADAALKSYNRALAQEKEPRMHPERSGVFGRLAY